MNVIEIKSLIKNFGKKTVLDRIDLQINAGEIYCLLGKNGVGKSTLIYLIMDLLEKDSGEILLFGHDNYQMSKELKMKIGIVSDQLSLIEEVSGYDYLNFVAKTYGLNKETTQQRIQDLVTYFFDSEEDIKKNISTYSTGMKKKMAFCGAVIHTPELLILDEPFSGLDPLVAKQMIAFINKYKREDRLIFISSHDLSYIEQVATQIGVLNDKKLVFNSTLADFTENGGDKLDTALFKLLDSNKTELNEINWL